MAPCRCLVASSLKKQRRLCWIAQRLPVPGMRPSTIASSRSSISFRPKDGLLWMASQRSRRAASESPYSSPRRPFSRPHTVGEPFVLHSSAWGMKPMPPGSARSKCSDTMPSPLSGRDREALLDELMDLKRMVAAQNKHLRRSKLLSSVAEHDNRKLERDILDLELKGISDALVDCDSPYLREKSQELKTRMNFLQTTCRVQGEELCLLRRDVRGTHTKELEMERDVFFEKAVMLQKFLKKLNSIHARINSQNKELVSTREKNQHLEEANESLQHSITEVHGSIEKINQGLLTYRFKTSEASNTIKRCMKKIKDLQRYASSTETLVQKHKDQKYRCQVRIPILVRRLDKSKKELSIMLKERDRGRAIKRPSGNLSTVINTKVDTSNSNSSSSRSKDKFGKKD